MSNINSGEYGYAEIDEALKELYSAAGIEPKPTEDISWRLAEQSPDFKLSSDIDPEMQFIINLYLKGTITLEEAIAPNPGATIENLRKEGHV